MPSSLVVYHHSSLLHVVCISIEDSSNTKTFNDIHCVSCVHIGLVSSLQCNLVPWPISSFLVQHREWWKVTISWLDSTCDCFGGFRRSTWGDHRKFGRRPTDRFLPKCRNRRESLCGCHEILQIYFNLLHILQFVINFLFNLYHCQYCITQVTVSGGHRPGGSWYWFLDNG